tara:strand:+ start:657 stop:917 length:261 start_codon:yes stop_codon:yes gene_type:complete
MFELLLCSMFTILPDYLVRRYRQGKRIGKEITLFSVWYELRYGITGMCDSDAVADHADFLFSPIKSQRRVILQDVDNPARKERSGG